MCVVGGIQGFAWHCTVYKQPRCYKWFLESPAPGGGRGRVGCFIISLSQADPIKQSRMCPEDEVEPL